MADDAIEMRCIISGFGVRDFFSSDQFRKLLFVSHKVNAAVLTKSL
jgi:hypothetical protein